MIACMECQMFFCLVFRHELLPPHYHRGRLRCQGDRDAERLTVSDQDPRGTRWVGGRAQARAALPVVARNDNVTTLSAFVL